MTVSALETSADEEVSADQEMAPAQQAMLVALAFAAAAEMNVTQVLDAWLAGRIDRVNACYTGAQKILQAIAKAVLAGEHFAELEWNHRVSPKIISGADHERLTRALDTITKDHAGARAADLVSAITRNETDTAASAEKMITRSTRLARAEVISAGRTAYAESVDQAIGDDDDYVWRFETSPGACARCVELAAKTFETFEAAPPDGAHPNCECVLSAEFREDR